MTSNALDNCWTNLVTLALLCLSQLLCNTVSFHIFPWVISISENSIISIEYAHKIDFVFESIELEMRNKNRKKIYVYRTEQNTVCDVLFTRKYAMEL